MEGLTEKQKMEICIEMLNKEPWDTLGRLALLKIGKISIDSNSSTTTIGNDIDYNGKKYKLKMKFTYTEIK
jgi:hypothetical protein